MNEKVNEKKNINKMITKTIKKWKKNNDFQCVAGSVFHKTRLLYSVIKRPFLNHTCPGHQRQYI